MQFLRGIWDVISMKRWAALEKSMEAIMAKIDELEAIVKGLADIVPAIANDYEAMIGIIAELQAKVAKLEATSDPALQERISNLVASANATLGKLKAAEASFPANQPAEPVATPE